MEALSQELTILLKEVLYGKSKGKERDELIMTSGGTENGTLISNASMGEDGCSER